jgi:glutathionylspermidine synthase
VNRITLQARRDWKDRLEQAGCLFHTIDGKPYWQEEAAYVLTLEEVEKIEAATVELHAMCMDLCAEEVKKGDYLGYGFPDEVKQLVETSHMADEPSLLGRLDLGYNGKDLKLYEYNADTPTALPEASIWQYHALQDRGWPDQFNSIHEQLTERLRYIGSDAYRIDTLHLTAQAEAEHEDWGNVHYLAEVAAEIEAFKKVISVSLDEIAWSGPEKVFADARGNSIELLFKLYPWEWMMADQFGWQVMEARTKYIEPAWKMLLSTKALLPKLWAANPGHPLLLESHFHNKTMPALDDVRWMRKPLLGREGANVAPATVAKINGRFAGMVSAKPQNVREEYDDRGYILQRYFQPMEFDDFTSPTTQVSPVLGSWLVGSTACGLGIREDAGITTNASKFVPHYFTE